MKEYVLGFAYDQNTNRYALIRKNKPEWQKGLINGVGGKIEENEIPIDAMIREFREEAGMKTEFWQWKHFCSMQGPDFKVYVFLTLSSDESAIYSATDEEVVFKSLREILANKREYISNIPWLILMSDDDDALNQPLLIEYRKEKIVA